MSTFTLAGLRSVQQDNPSIVAHLELRSDADPGCPSSPAGGSASSGSSARRATAPATTGT